MRIAFKSGASEVERPRWRLTGGGADIDLLDGVYTIGRASEAEIHLESPQVSRHHAKVTINGQLVTVQDLGSKNGTYLGDHQVDGVEEIGPNALLRVGPFFFTLRELWTEPSPTTETGDAGRKARLDPAGS